MIKPVRSIALLGPVGAQEIRAIEEAAATARLDVVRVEKRHDLRRSIDEREPVAVVLATEAEGAQGLCADLRGCKRFAHIPILGVSAHRSNLSFVELYQWGGDDLVVLDGSGPLVRRLRPLLASPPVSSTHLAAFGDAVIAGGDAEWRAVVSRALSNAGMATRIAVDSSDVVEESRNARVVVTADDLVPHGAEAALIRARKMGIETPWVIVAHPKRVDELHALVNEIRRVAIVDAFAPPENVLFVANDLAREGLNQRHSSRLLFGSAVTFRAAGREDDDEVGFTYNVSESGVFVRTLVPFEAGDEVWLELSAPRSPRRVRLSGTVAWRRGFGPNGNATVPPGFGVHLVDGLGDDLERWRAGCVALATNAVAPATPLPFRLRPSLILSSLLERASV